MLHNECLVSWVIKSHMLQHSAFVHGWYEMSVYPFLLPSVGHRKWLKTNFLYSDKQWENPFTAKMLFALNFLHKETIENECSEYLLPLFLNSMIWMWFLHITVFFCLWASSSPLSFSMWYKIPGSSTEQPELRETVCMYQRTVNGLW